MATVRKTRMTLNEDEINLIEDALSFYALGCEQDDYHPSEVHRLLDRVTAKRRVLEGVS